ncbi:TPA: hypothetical protein OF688_001745 [Escherichia coli]|nr:hypothetical protein [Escherichia coli]
MKAQINFRDCWIDEDHTIESAFVRQYTSKDILSIMFHDDEINKKYHELIDIADKIWTDKFERIITQNVNDFEKRVFKEISKL